MFIDLKWNSKGENNKRAILNWQKVREIRASREKTEVLAKKYGVAIRTINCIKNNERWVEA